MKIKKTLELTRSKHHLSKLALSLYVKKESCGKLKSLGSSSTPRKVASGNLMKNIVQGLDLGPKALRKSWEGNMNVKSRESPRLKAPRKLMNERLPSKEDTKIITLKSTKEENKVNAAIKKASTVGDMSGMVKAARIASVGKKSSNNEFPENLVKVP
ncbi:hypothetical protein BUALT_Bualt09G0008700 [Buddleja alternifolia]|uniref:Uncharacterized protein n=1 Tax=Buddleja alternifolia TaxID=168488 RepID=A0AAV6X9V0_9LAMI|nr:hypothetical protein BUALT_Bualt09G0008700 [Buddleja alternifolia]